MLSKEPMDYADIARELNLSVQNVKDIERIVLKKLAKKAKLLLPYLENANEKELYHRLLYRGSKVEV
jgi:hypothetical protein